MLVNNSRWLGGAELYLEHLMRSFPPEIPVVLAARDSTPPRLVESADAAGARVAWWRPSPSGLWRLFREMRGAALVHLNMAWTGDNAHAIAAAWLSRRPVVATVHIWVRPGSPLRRRVMRLGYRRFDRVIAVSGEIEKLLVSELRVPATSVRRVANGVPRADPVVRDRRPAVVLGGLGRLTEAKGFDLLIEAVRRLRAMGYPVEASIAGEGPERDRLEGAARDLPVRFLGFVEDTRSFLATIDVFCLPSRWEGLPFALLEAMMAGTPCVAADVGDVPVALGTAGRLVPADDAGALTAALEELVTSERLRSELGEAAHRRARDHFAIDAFIDRTLAVYRELDAVS